MMEAQGPLKRFYAWPVSSTTIAVWQLLPGMLGAALMYLGSAMVINLLFDLGWPLWGPALFFAAAVPFGMGAFHAVEGSIWRKTFSFTAAAFLATFWLAGRYEGPIGEPAIM